MILRLAADENFDNDILRGLLRLYPELDIVRIQDTDIYGAEDPLVLEWTAREGRLLLTHDLRTMPTFAYERMAANLPVAGVVVVTGRLSIGQIIDELALIIGASDIDEWRDRVVTLPM